MNKTTNDNIKINIRSIITEKLSINMTDNQIQEYYRIGKKKILLKMNCHNIKQKNISLKMPSQSNKYCDKRTQRL